MKVTNACLVRKQTSALEANFENLSVVAHEPSGFRIRKSDRPVTADLRQFEPGLSFIRSPSGCARFEVRLSLAVTTTVRSYSWPNSSLIAPIIVVFQAAHIGEAEDRSRNRRLGGKRPCLAAIIRGGGLGIAVARQVAATHNAMPGIAKRYREAARVSIAPSGVSYAFHVSPPSRVARIRAMLEPPVAIQAFCHPSS